MTEVIKRGILIGVLEPDETDEGYMVSDQRKLEKR